MYSLILLVVFVALLHRYLERRYNYWNRQMIPNPPSRYFFGNLAEAVFFRKSRAQVYEAIYKKYKDYDFIGFYKMMTPSILIRSPDLVKIILVQDQEHFQANDFDIGDHDLISSKNVFLQNGQKWKTTRSQLTPTFTSGKLRGMVALSNTASNNMIVYINSNLTQQNQHGFDSRDLFSKYVADNIASCAFGLEANSFHRNGMEFLLKTKRIFAIDIKAALKVLTITTFPSISKMLNLQFIPDSVSRYFIDVIEQAIYSRQNGGAVYSRQDFLYLMIALQEKLGKDEIGTIDIVAQSIQFIVNGMESSVATLGFVMYFMATHSTCQEILRAEIDLALEQCKEIFTYDILMGMKYLDQVLNETLRLYPPAAASAKRCTKKYTFAQTDKTPSVTIEPGTPVIIPISAIHRDGNYYTKPDHFDPERFSDERREFIRKNVFLPFGDGPRACLGKRFAVLQIKMGIVRILKDFEIKINQRTVQPIELSPKSFLSVPANPLYFNFYKRRGAI